MAGIYVHIPFCKQICHYCDFYKVANLQKVGKFVEAIVAEIDIKRGSMNETVETIYFGGGTPSLLKFEELQTIVNKIFTSFRISETAEITIELNPEDVSAEYYLMLKDLGFNRLSIGIQSFNDKISKFLNRRHSATTAHRSIELAHKAGFSNISADLIYGIPNQRIEDFLSDLEDIKSKQIAHLSAYHLGIENNTYFGKLKKLNKIQEISEHESEKFFYTLSNWAEKNGYEHYEVSNFAYRQQYSTHNTNYWFHLPYLSFGASAHSFINNARHYNFANLNKYINAVLQGKSFYEVDELTDNDYFNEFIMLRLRTKWGINLQDIKTKFGDSYFKHCHNILSKFETSGHIIREDDTIKLTTKGFFASDYVVREFFHD